MKRISGLKLLDEREGAGLAALKGDRVIYNSRLFLNKGDEVPLNAKLAECLPEASPVSTTTSSSGDVESLPVSSMP